MLKSSKILFPALLILSGITAVGCGAPAGGHRDAPVDTTRAVHDRTRPLIGITSAYEGGPDWRDASVTTPVPFVRAVIEAGATPVVLPVIDDRQAADHYLQLLDGLVLIGGMDIPPRAYNEEPIPQTVPMPDELYNFERQLIAAWLETRKPVLGVCLGLQFTNVVSGGSLIQDIPTQVGNQVIHRSPTGATHPVTVSPASRLRELLGTDTLIVNSNHHQAVKELGKGLKVVARSPDDVVEALEFADGRFGIFVQWHPERMDSPDHRNRIFGALVDACRSQPASN